MNLQDIQQYWMEASEDSFETSKTLFKNKRYVHSMSFLHLALEKILKGLFVFKNQKEPPYIHNLQIIAANISDVSFDIETLNFLAEVTTYNISARYDDYKKNFYQLCTKDFAKQKIKKAEEIIRWIKSQLK